MSCQAKALLPVSINHEGTASRAFSAWPKAARSRSSSQSRTWLASPNVDLLLALSEGGEGVGPAQPLQAGGPLREGHAQRRVPLGHQDLLLDHRVVHEQHRVVQPLPSRSVLLA